RFVPAEGRFYSYTERDGLPNDVVYGVLPDNDGVLWLSTNNGIVRFDPKSETFRRYDASDGLQGTEFNAGAYHKSVDGELFFGGINGYNSFYPNAIRDNALKLDVVLTVSRCLTRIMIYQKLRSTLIRSGCRIATMCFPLSFLRCT